VLGRARRQVARALRLAARGAEQPRETWQEVRSAAARSHAESSAGAADPQSGGLVTRHVALPLDGDAPAVRSDLDASVVDLVVTVEADDLQQRPEVVEELADLGAAATARGMNVVAVVYEGEEAVGKTHAPPRLPLGLPLAHPDVARGWAAGLARTFPQLRGERSVVVDSSVSLDAAAVAALAAELGPDVVLAQAVLRHPNETVVSLGAVFGAPLAAPGALLEGFPSEDAEALGVTEISAADRPAFAVRTSCLVVPPLTTDLPLAVTGLSLSVSSAAQAADAGDGRVVAVPLGRVHQRREPARRLDAVAQDLLQAWSGTVDVHASSALAARGLRLDASALLPTGAVPARVARPVVVRADRASVREGVPRLRWSIKTAAWAGARGDDWGDVFFARDLAAGLRRRGQEVVVDNRQSSVRPESEHLDDVSLVLRGLDRVPLNPGAVNVLWVISHPDRVSDRELAGYDLRFAAGPHWARRTTTRTGLLVVPLLQATDPARFRPGPVDAALASDVLFVGKTREVFRPVVRDALAAGLDLSVWGEGWDRFIPSAHVRGSFLDNEALPAAYRSARIVLNDHWGDMAREGFISNRVFDAVASGALVVSDEVDGLAEVFGPSVRTYRSVGDLRRVTRPQDGDEAGRAEAAAAVARDHSFERRASDLLDAVSTVLAARPADRAARAL
jgi:hypothetical protein